jgi:hypothetical protein
MFGFIEYSKVVTTNNYIALNITVIITQGIKISMSVY